jgi:hypothetical protein
MEQIEQTWVQPVNRSSTMIPQKSIEAIHCVWNVIVTSPVDQVNLLVGVEMAEPEPIFPLWVQACRSSDRRQAQYPDNQEYRVSTTR